METRNHQLDNFKYILILLVVIGHFIEPLLDKIEWVRSFYVFIYLFHMPMFAFASGCLSKAKLDKKEMKQLFTSLVIPYFTLEVIFTVFDFLIFKKSTIEFSFLQPYWILWYLFSLLLWKVLAPFFYQLKYPIFFSFLIGLLSGMNGYGYNLSFSRTFVFFPFFLMGFLNYKNSFSNIEIDRHAKTLFLSTLLFALLAIFYFKDFNTINRWWLYGSASYSQLNVDVLHGIAYRSMHYFLAFVLGTSLLFLTSKKKLFVSKIGANTLTIYILHAFLVKYLQSTTFYQHVREEHVFLLILLSVLLVHLLATKPMIKIGDWIIHPIKKLKLEKYIFK